MSTISGFKIVGGADVCLLFPLYFDGGLVYHRLLAGALYGALGLYPTVAGGFSGCVGVAQHFLVVRLKYCSHVFCTVDIEILKFFSLNIFPNISIYSVIL